MATIMSIVNQIKLLGEEFPHQRVVEKLLVSLPERYESKISSLEDTKDLSKITVAELINALQVVEQRRTMRQKEEDQKVEGAYLAKASSLKGKGKFVQCNKCKKTGHEEEDCWHKGKPQCFKCKRFGYIQKNSRTKIEELQNEDHAKMAHVEEVSLF